MRVYVYHTKVGLAQDTSNTGSEHEQPGRRDTNIKTHKGEFLTLGRILLYKHTLTTRPVPQCSLERGMDNIYSICALLCHAIEVFALNPIVMLTKANNKDVPF